MQMEFNFRESTLSSTTRHLTFRAWLVNLHLLASRYAVGIDNSGIVCLSDGSEPATLWAPAQVS